MGNRGICTIKTEIINEYNVNQCMLLQSFHNYDFSLLSSSNTTNMYFHKLSRLEWNKCFSSELKISTIILFGASSSSAESDRTAGIRKARSPPRSDSDGPASVPLHY